MKSLRRDLGGTSQAVQLHREALQRRTQADWVNREYAELMTGSIKRISDFLTAFHLSCSSRLSDLNSRLTRMERKMEYLEAKVEMRAADDPDGVNDAAGNYFLNQQEDNSCSDDITESLA